MSSFKYEKLTQPEVIAIRETLLRRAAAENELRGMLSMIVAQRGLRGMWSLNDDGTALVQQVDATEVKQDEKREAAVH